jgi:alpha-methylacyl-CoA racemase
MARDGRMEELMGPLQGMKVIEIAGIGPGPFCAMMLSDMGAEVLRVDRMTNVRAGDARSAAANVHGRGRRSIAVDLKTPEGVDLVLRMIDQADALIEGFRPGVMERLGLGPDVCLARNPRLVYGRMTGWGQEGPMSQAAGHDINYIALAGVLHAIGRKGQKPTPPLNLVGDYGGGGMLLAFGVVCALLERAGSGKGQVVDAAMVDGAAALMSAAYGSLHTGRWVEERGSNTLDSGTPYYETYETADGKYVSLGSLEPQFYAELMERLGLTKDLELSARDPGSWPRLRETLTAIFSTKTRDQWTDLLAGTDVCFAPVLSMSEAVEHPHNVARGTFIELEGVKQPAPAPRFSRTRPKVTRPPSRAGQDTDEALRDWGFTEQEIGALHAAKAVV